MERDKRYSLDLPDVWQSAKVINAKEKSNTLNEEELEKLFYQTPTTKGRVSAFDLEWFVAAYKKSGAQKIKSEPIYYEKQYKNGSVGIEHLYPMQFLTYEGYLDVSKCLKLIYN